MAHKDVKIDTGFIFVGARAYLLSQIRRGGELWPAANTLAVPIDAPVA